MFPWEWSKKKFFFLKKKSKMAVFQKWPFFKIANSQNFFMKISHTGPWISRIDWCKGHWCGSTYMVSRLSYVSSKTCKKCIFCVFRLLLSLRRTVSQPHRLKNFKNWRFWKSQFFWVCHFEIFFLLLSHENQSKCIG